MGRWGVAFRRVCEQGHQVADLLLWPAGDLSEADEALTRAHLHQDLLGMVHAHARGPAGALACDGYRM